MFTSRPTSFPELRPMLKNTIVVTGLLAAILAGPAFADEIGDVNKLLRAGQYPEALGKADAYLGKKPRDAQMRFLKGVILTEQNRSAEAIAVFTKLTEDHPDLPEPYNNLAVLYAAGGQYEKARTALDAAIRTNPAYATAYENLGDIHAKLASQAYDRALQLDSGNSGAKSKLTLVRTLVSSANGANPKVAAGTQPQPQPPVAAGKPVPDLPPAAPAVPAPVQQPRMAAVTPPSSPAQQPRVAAATPAPTPPAAQLKPEPAKASGAKPAITNARDDDEVLAAVQSWAKAWSAQDVKTYLAFYGNDFKAPNGLSRKAWEEERRDRISGKGRINVKVESPQVAVKGNVATVKFRQVYTSDRLTANARKTLTLARQGEKWKITQEQAGS